MTRKQNPAPEVKAKPETETAGAQAADKTGQDQTGAGSPAPVADPALQPATDAPDQAPDVAPTVLVTGPKKGRWRAGRFFGPTPTAIRFEDLSEAELAALTGDPALSVHVTDAPC